MKTLKSPYLKPSSHCYSRDNFFLNGKCGFNVFDYLNRGEIPKTWGFRFKTVTELEECSEGIPKPEEEYVRDCKKLDNEFDKEFNMVKRKEAGNKNTELYGKIIKEYKK